LSVPGHRNRSTGIVMAGYAVGGLAAPLLGAALLPGTSFRWLYVIGVLPAVLILPFAWKLLPETPVHLLRLGRVDAAHRLTTAMGLPAPVLVAAGKRHFAGIGPLFSAGAAGATLLFWVMTFCGLLLVFGITAWLPTIMQANGYSLGSALLQTAAMWIGVGVGVIIGGRIADKIGAKPVVVTAFLTGAVSLVAMSLPDSRQRVHPDPLPGRYAWQRTCLGPVLRPARGHCRTGLGRLGPDLWPLRRVELLHLRHPRSSRSHRLCPRPTDTDWRTWKPQRRNRQNGRTRRGRWLEDSLGTSTELLSERPLP
jgi:MFS family permease